MRGIMMFGNPKQIILTLAFIIIVLAVILIIDSIAHLIKNFRSERKDSEEE